MDFEKIMFGGAIAATVIFIILSTIIHYFVYSSILGGSPQKMQPKPMATNSKTSKPGGSAVLVSDIGIVKRGVSKKDGGS